MRSSRALRISSAWLGTRKGQPIEKASRTASRFLTRSNPISKTRTSTFCVEYLNSKVNHPDYDFDHMKYGVEMCKRVNSPRVKILYDMYHVQIMEGDIIRMMRDNIQYIGHFHTAGNPGRHEMDDTQEMNYKGIAKAIADLNFPASCRTNTLPRAIRFNRWKKH